MFEVHPLFSIRKKYEVSEEMQNFSKFLNIECLAQSIFASILR